MAYPVLLIESQWHAAAGTAVAYREEIILALNYRVYQTKFVEMS
jgi:hypothetical protein